MAQGCKVTQAQHLSWLAREEHIVGRGERWALECYGASNLIRFKIFTNYGKSWRGAMGSRRFPGDCIDPFDEFLSRVFELGIDTCVSV